MGKISLQKITLVAILLLGLLLRLANLGQSFWLDEASQAQQSAMPVYEIWHNRPGDFHPPLFYILAHYWQQIDTSETRLRMLPVTFGVLNIAVIYFLAEKLSSKSVKIFGVSVSSGIIAAFLLAINPYHVYYSQEYRSYSLLALLGTLSMYLLFIKSRWLWIINALLLFTHYSSILLIFAQLFYVMAFAKSQMRGFLLQLFAGIALWLVWLPQFMVQLHAGVNIDEYLPGWRSVLTVPTLKSLPLIIFKFVAGRINLIPKITYGVYICFVLATTFLGLVLAKTHRRFILTWLFVPIIASIWLSFLVPQTQPFRLIFTLPALTLIFTQAVLKYPRLILTLLVYIAVVGNLLYFLKPRLQREQWRQAIEFLSEQKASIIVKFPDKFATFSWYEPNLQVIGAVPNFPAKNDEVSRILSQTSLDDNVYILEYLTELTDPARLVNRSIVELGFQEQEAYNFEGVGIIYHYHKSL